MNLGRALELKPLLLAAVIGAGLLWLLRRDPKTGALLGAGVQLGVRLLGAS